ASECNVASRPGKEERRCLHPPTGYELPARSYIGRRCLHPPTGYELPARSYIGRRCFHPATSYRPGATSGGGAFIPQQATGQELHRAAVLSSRNKPPARSYYERWCVHPAAVKGDIVASRPAASYRSLDTKWSSFSLQLGPQVRQCNYNASGS
ncbi:unnamed protein product, partial [Pleuronectes platessa]